MDKHEHRRALKGNHVLARGGERRDVPNFSPMTDSHKLTTAAGIAVVDNQNIITAGRREPQLLQDNWFLEKLAHFPREVIPERRMHANGAGAFGRITVTQDITHLTRMNIFLESGNEPIH